MNPNAVKQKVKKQYKINNDAYDHVRTLVQATLVNNNISRHHRLNSARQRDDLKQILSRIENLPSWLTTSKSAHSTIETLYEIAHTVLVNMRRKHTRSKQGNKTSDTRRQSHRHVDTSDLASDQQSPEAQDGSVSERQELEQSTGLDADLDDFIDDEAYEDEDDNMQDDGHDEPDIQNDHDEDDEDDDEDDDDYDDMVDNLTSDDIDSNAVDEKNTPLSDNKIKFYRGNPHWSCTKSSLRPRFEILSPAKSHLVFPLHQRNLITETAANCISITGCIDVASPPSSTTAPVALSTVEDLDYNKWIESLREDLAYDPSVHQIRYRLPSLEGSAMCAINNQRQWRAVIRTSLRYPDVTDFHFYIEHRNADSVNTPSVHDPAIQSEPPAGCYSPSKRGRSVSPQPSPSTPTPSVVPADGNSNGNETKTVKRVKRANRPVVESSPSSTPANADDISSDSDLPLVYKRKLFPQAQPRASTVQPSVTDLSRDPISVTGLSDLGLPPSELLGGDSDLPLHPPPPPTTSHSANDDLPDRPHGDETGVELIPETDYDPIPPIPPFPGDPVPAADDDVTTTHAVPVDDHVDADPKVADTVTPAKPVLQPAGPDVSVTSTTDRRPTITVTEPTPLVVCRPEHVLPNVDSPCPAPANGVTPESGAPTGQAKVDHTLIPPSSNSNLYQLDSEEENELANLFDHQDTELVDLTREESIDRDDGNAGGHGDGDGDGDDDDEEDYDDYDDSDSLSMFSDMPGFNDDAADFSSSGDRSKDNQIAT